MAENNTVSEEKSRDTDGDQETEARVIHAYQLA